MPSTKNSVDFNPALKFARSDQRGVSILATSETAVAAGRFDKFVVDLLEKRDEVFQHPHLLIVALATAFEGLTNEADLRAFLKELPNACHWGDGLYVTWAREQGIARRRISPLLRIARQQAPFPPTDWNAVVDQLAEVVSRIYPRKKHTRTSSKLSSLFMDAQCWLYTYLPMPHVAHATGAVPMTHLPDSAWLRRFQLPLPSPTAEREDKVVEEAEERIVEALYSNAIQLSGAWFIERLEKITQGLTSTGSQVSDARAWQIVSQRLRDLSIELQDCGPIEALVLGWALDIATHGTSQKVNPRVGTLSKYIYVAAGRLHRKLREQQSHPMSLSHEKWQTFFKELIDENPSDQSLRAALSSFHRYLCRMLGTDFIPWLFNDRNASKQPPRANVVWPHEFDRLHSIFRHLTQDQRLISQLDAWCALLRDSTLRFGELVGLQLHSIQINEGSIELEVAPHRGRHPLKTHAARRVLQVVDPAAVAGIRNWLDRREKEAAAPSDFLFGDPHRPDRIYQLGKCYRLFNKALKLSTGDASVSMHITRHAYVSVAMDTALSQIGEKFSEINPIHRIKVVAGHAAEWITILTYSHLPEDSLRAQIDRQIAQRLTSCAAVSRWTGLTEENLRQRKHRCAKDGWRLWHAVLDKVGSPTLQGIVLPAAAPSEPIPTEITVTSEIVWHVLSDLDSGLPHDRVASRCSVPECVVSRIQTIAQSIRLLDSETPLSDHIVCRFDRLHNQDWQRFISHVSRLDFEEASAAIDSWRRCARDLMFSLDHPSKARPFVRALRDGGIPITRLVVRASRKPSSAPAPLPAPENNPTLEKALSLLAQVYNSSPQVEQMSPRRGRPSVYLQLFTTTMTGSACAAPAACDMRSMNGAMTVLFTFHKLKKSLSA